MVTATGPFEISLTSGTGFGPTVTTAAPVFGAVGPVVVYVRYNPMAGRH
jgi:hypothetical protein